MNKTIHETDAVFNDILQGMSASARTATARTTGQALRRSQQQRIRAQKAPDGTSFPARRRQLLHTHRKVTFLWNNQIRTLRQWHHQKLRYGRAITGMDDSRSGLRTFYRSDIARFIEITSVSARRTSKKYTPMFNKIRTYRWLKMKAGQDGVSVGYDGLTARIARVHQYGLRDEAGPQVLADYPKRELLGFSQADERLIHHTVIRSLGRAAQ